jgi:hypothetical protein
MLNNAGRSLYPRGFALQLAQVLGKRRSRQCEVLFHISDYDFLGVRAWRQLLLMKLRPANPGILPRHRNTLIVATEAHIGSVAVTDLEGLVLF